MKISREWLLDYVDFSTISFDEIAELITTRVAEIESVKTVGAPIKFAKIVEVLDVQSVEIANKEKSEESKQKTITLVTVTDSKNTYKVICGAKNVRVGMLSVLIPPGGVVRKSGQIAEEEELLEVTAKSVYGVLSEGLLVSESELGIGPSHDGILDLDKSVFSSGNSLSEHSINEDFVIEIDNKSLTHRPDLWGHFGFARELSAILKLPFKLDLDESLAKSSKILSSSKKTSMPSPSISNYSDCSRLSLLEISNISNPISPIWLRKRLFTIGAGVRNLLVDASNYVLHDAGQPNHAYDRRSLSGDKLEARRAKEGEVFKGLDGVERALTVEDIVIADDKYPVALAGIIGGDGFSVREDTTQVILEAACFNSVLIRQSCKRNQLRTDSSVRFEKSLAPEQTPLALIRYLDVLGRAGQSPVVGGYLDANDGNANPPIMIPYSASYIRERLGGVPKTDQEIAKILTDLKFEIARDNIKVPYFRATKDISILDDIVEEVGRMIGYENIPEAPPRILSTGSKKGLIQKAEGKIRSVLSSIGYSEVYNYTFSSPELGESLGYKLTNAIEVENPVDKNLRIVQVSVVPNLIDAAVRNLKNDKSLAGFEIGRSYHALLYPGIKSSSAKVTDKVTETRLTPLDHYDSVVRERRLFGLFLTGSKLETNTNSDPVVPSGQVFYSARESISRVVFELSGRKAEFVPIEGKANILSLAEDYTSLKTWMHPGRAASVHVGGICLGLVSEVRPSIVNLIGGGTFSDRIVVGELDTEALIATSIRPTKYQDYSKFPESFFEVSLVVSKTELWSTIANYFEKHLPRDLLSQIEAAGIYSGPPLGANEKSVSIKFTFSSSTGTISSEELSSLRAKVMSSAEEGGYQLRS